jgi:hypothetical protein
VVCIDDSNVVKGVKSREGNLTSVLVTRGKEQSKKEEWS